MSEIKPIIGSVIASNNLGINPVKILPTTTGKEALEKESEIYHRYKSLRLDEDSMARWHRYSGYTECYPVSLKQEFITIFDNYN